jgi:NADPH:quinone reductase-like Zn-dependent oxidoreductase
MKAIVHDTYGPPDVLRLKEVDTPVVGDGDVLVRVHAAAVHVGDYFILTGVPYVYTRPAYGLRRPRVRVRGHDLAGVVTNVGRDVRRFQPGDEVFGWTTTGSLAEYVCVGEDHLAPKPANVTMEQAGAVTVSAMAALHALRDAAKVQPGQRVLIVGASGGVGTFAVQIAKAAGAEVTGVCSTAKVELVRSLGADHVVDHHREDFTRTGERYDLLIDNAGSHSWSALRRVLSDDATCVLVGGSKDNRWLGPLSRWATIRLAALGASQRVAVLLTDMRREDLDTLRELFEAGTRNRVGTGAFLMFLQSFTGVNIITYYAPRIFETLGVSGTSNKLLSKPSNCSSR